ncbi:MAG: hypothetical protein IJY94_01455 [Clostridia bacterium]|nr:hypothetical protein [Clostridia bacterium]
MNITEKTAYLKGLMAGLNIDESKPEGKLLTAIVETLDEMANEIADLGDVAEYLEDYIDEVDHDLGDLETEYYDCDCDCDCDDDDYCFCDDCDEEDCTDCILCDEDDEDEEETEDEE